MVRDSKHLKFDTDSESNLSVVFISFPLIGPGFEPFLAFVVSVFKTLCPVHSASFLSARQGTMFGGELASALLCQRII